MNERLGLSAALIVMGAGWGMCVPLMKLAVSEGYGPYGLIFWQMAIITVMMAAISLLRGRSLRFGRRHLWRFAMIACLGALIPDGISYAAAVHMPAGILAVLLSTVPLFAFPIALMLGNDRFRLVRVGGLFCGMVGIILLVGPEFRLPDPALAWVILFALLAPLSYASEGNLVARFGTGGLDPIQLLTGASAVGTLIALPLAVGSGQWITPLPPYGVPDLALVASSAIHAFVYAGYVWMIGRAGAVFTTQVSYLVTGFGVIWSMALLGEAYAANLWAALALMMVGVFLVQPEPRLKLAPEPEPEPAPQEDLPPAGCVPK